MFAHVTLPTTPVSCHCHRCVLMLLCLPPQSAVTATDVCPCYSAYHPSQLSLCRLCKFYFHLLKPHCCLVLSFRDIIFQLISTNVWHAFFSGFTIFHHISLCITAAKRRLANLNQGMWQWRTYVSVCMYVCHLFTFQAALHVMCASTRAHILP